MNLKARAGNVGFWASLISFLYLLLLSFNICVVGGDLGLLIELIAQVLVFMGIINNPTTKNRYYSDD
ncbi:Uncharacterized membrane protein [Seinonella peptonophila]|uniref:Uncharacterized membrane protein n=1 Tax=Seinonella peptonophila TaxID=112248 RepID=A0A1M4WFZ3_9BACL|nr:phage holin [Seinonella peptonophila]SHE80156.1 Uncharacterized membrane protein [Seinonella peptonophila]